MTTATIEAPASVDTDELLGEFITTKCQTDELYVRKQLDVEVRINGCGPKLTRRRHIEIAVLEEGGASVDRWQGEAIIGNRSGSCLWEQDVTEAGIRYAAFLVDQQDGVE